MDRLEEAKGNNLEIWNTLSITSHPARCFLKVTEAHTGKLFLVNYSSDNSPTPPDRHNEADHLIYQKYNDLLSF